MRDRKRMIPLFLVLALISSRPIALAGGKERAKPTVELQILVDEQTSKPDHPIPIKSGQSVALHVEVVRRDGTQTDVTRDPKTSYFSLTPWSVRVSSDGVVTVAGSSEFDPSRMADTELGSITVTYGLVGDADIGAASIMFKVVK